MGRSLIVANQTLGGEALDRAIRDRISRGIKRFYVVVPSITVKLEATDWRGGFGVDEYIDPATVHVLREAREEAERQHLIELEDAQRRARQRLEQMIATIEAEGGQADGEVGTDDALEATRSALERHDDLDEVIVSTLPGGISRWLSMDLPSRIARLTDLPVTTIEADE
jgi:hypothetical protein